MTGFLRRALEKLPRLDKAQVQELVRDLALEHENLETAVNSLTAALIVLDTEHRVQFLNRAAERLLPLAGPDLTEKRLWALLRDDELAAWLQTTLESLESVQGWECVLDRPGGIRRYLSLSVMPLVSRGRIEGSVVLAQDVSDRKAKEGRLRRAESLASLTTLAAGVAHEIKNPLGSIGIHIQLIQKALRAAPPPGETAGAVNRYLEVINEEIDRLNAIVVDFLFAVRPMDTQLSRRSLHSLLKEVFEFLRYELEQSGVRLVWSLEADLDQLDLDERFLKQALLNIVKNSLAAMEGGGTFTVQTRRDGAKLLLSLKDTGSGIAEEHLEKIFEPYFTTKASGSGLGLTLVYKIVKEHGGDVQVVSSPGKGTTLTLVLPLPPAETPLLAWEGEAL